MRDEGKGMPETRLKGTVLAEGIAIGKVCLHNEDVLESVSKREIPADRVGEEKKRLIRAIEKTKEELRISYDGIARSLGAMEAEVFNAHILILEDFPFINQIEETIERELINAEYALLQTAKSYEQRFRLLPTDYFRERTQDIDDITRRLLKNMGVQHTGFMCVCPVGQPVIVVANDLMPSLITALGDREVAGIAVEGGSAISHGAILAKALGVPAMIGIDGLITSVNCGMDLLIDANEGRVFVGPDPETIMNYRSRLTVTVPVTTRHAFGYTTTKDGEKVHLLANAGNVRDIENARKHGVKDIGLFRTELLFLGRANEPDIDEQVEVYGRVMASTDGAVTFRLLDIGGDKILDYLLLPQQSNPNLGLRGVRVYEKYPNIVASQIEALLIAKGENPMRIMVPMVSTLAEFREMRTKIHHSLDRLSRSHRIDRTTLKIGCMIEVPSAVYLVRHLADEADFLSIGTNDLIQYIMGVDRSNSHLVELSNPLQPAILKVLNDIAEMTRSVDTEVSICGEIAGDPEMATILVGFGYRYLSMNPHKLDPVGDAVSKYTLEELKKRAMSLLESKTLEDVRRLVAQKMVEHWDTPDSDGSAASASGNSRGAS